ncbi:MAG: tetratricopeptide repeat protein [Planctomycetaceae bacterium]|nr:tetratricopeptide repeat protein [Planctomycetaceae bacterium]
MSHQQWDYAVKMFSTAVQLVPDHMAYRQHLRGAERKMYNDNKSGARMAGMKLMGIRGRIKKAQMKEDWTSIERAAEEGLAINPWDAQLNASLAEACQYLGYPEVSLFAWRTASENDPTNVEYLRSLGKMLAERGEYDEAITCFEKVHKIDPLDGQSRSMVTSLLAEKTRDRGGYMKADNTRDVETAYDHDDFSGAGGGNESVAPGESKEADLQRAIRKEPEKPEGYLKLADFYRQEKRMDEAAATLEQALHASGGDQAIQEQLQDLELDRLRRNLEMARQLTRNEPENEQAAENATNLDKELLKREIEIFRSRVERYPQDSRLKFELARRFMRCGRHQQAIPLLQQAATDVRLKARVLVALGKCFLQDKQYKLAVSQLRNAIEAINPQDDAKLFAEAHYLSGWLSEKLGNNTEAERHFSEVIGVDYAFKDARQRLERLQEGSPEAAS